MSSSCRCCPISSRSLSTWLCSRWVSAISWSRRCLSNSSCRWCSNSLLAAFTYTDTDTWTYIVHTDRDTPILMGQRYCHGCSNSLLAKTQTRGYTYSTQTDIGRETHTHGYYMLHTDRHTPILTAVDVLTPFWQPFRQTYRHRHMDIHTPHRQTDTGRERQRDRY